MSVVLTAACGGEGSLPSGAGGGEEGGGGGGGGAGGAEVVGDEPGVQANGCPAGELLTDGACAPAGVPFGSCAEGFELDPEGACSPVLPDAPCPPGQVALPGEVECRPLAPCSAGKYGEAPHPGGTLFVDASYAGGSDGSEARPFRTIQAAIDASPSGGRVAVAEGVYAEALRLDKPLVLAGRCPSGVEVASPEPGKPSLLVLGGQAQVVRGLALSGVDRGLVVLSAEGVRVEDVWVHDTGKAGVVVHDAQGPASATLARTLVERTRGHGLVVGGSVVVVEESVIRDVELEDAGAGRVGQGVVAVHHAETGARGPVTLRRSVVERTSELGVLAAGARVKLEESVVRLSGLAKDAPQGGRGLVAQQHPAGTRAELELEGSAVERCGGVGVAVFGSDARVSRSVVRKVRAPASPGLGQAVGGGLAVRPAGPAPGDDGRGHLVLSRSVVASNEGIGLVVIASDALVEGTSVRDTRPSGGRFGRGVTLQDVDPFFGLEGRARAALVGSVVEGSREAGVVCLGSDLELDGTLVRGTAPAEADGRLGVGVVIQEVDGTGVPASGRLVASAVEESHAMGVLVFDADAELVATRVEDTAARSSDGLFGDGVSVVATAPGSASASVFRSRIARSARAGLANFGAEVSLGASSLSCNAIDLSGEPLSAPATFVDAGDNACGCPADRGACVARSTFLEPPEPLPP